VSGELMTMLVMMMMMMMMMMTSLPSLPSGHGSSFSFGVAGSFFLVDGGVRDHDSGEWQEVKRIQDVRAEASGGLRVSGWR
jgi:hypothetical protein